jgi:hypothetical protein
MTAWSFRKNFKGHSNALNLCLIPQESSLTGPQQPAGGSLRTWQTSNVQTTFICEAADVVSDVAKLLYSL